MKRRINNSRKTKTTACGMSCRCQNVSDKLIYISYGLKSYVQTWIYLYLCDVAKASTKIRCVITTHTLFSEPLVILYSEPLIILYSEPPMILYSEPLMILYSEQLLILYSEQLPILYYETWYNIEFRAINDTVLLTINDTAWATTNNVSRAIYCTVLWAINHTI